MQSIKSINFKYLNVYLTIILHIHTSHSTTGKLCMAVKGDLTQRSKVM